MKLFCAHIHRRRRSDRECQSGFVRAAAQHRHTVSEGLYGEFVSSISSMSLQHEAADAFFQALIAAEEFSREPVCSLLFRTPERKVVTNSAADVCNNM